MSGQRKLELYSGEELIIKIGITLKRNNGESYQDFKMRRMILYVKVLLTLKSEEEFYKDFPSFKDASLEKKEEMFKSIKYFQEIPQLQTASSEEKKEIQKKIKAINILTTYVDWIKGSRSYHTIKGKNQRDKIQLKIRCDKGDLLFESEKTFKSHSKRSLRLETECKIKELLSLNALEDFLSSSLE